MQEQALVCLFGVVNRSIRYTWNNIKTNIIEHLKKNGVNVTIYVFNLICDNGLVDCINVNNNDHQKIQPSVYECKLQSEEKKILIIR
jgi:hypothetical protein